MSGACSLQLAWACGRARHRDTLYLPGRSAAGLRRDLGCPAGHDPDVGQLGIPRHDAARVVAVPRSAFQARISSLRRIVPRPGRWYPARLLPGVACAGRVFRVVSVTADTLRLDLNHPLAGFDVRVQLRDETGLPAAPRREPPPALQRLRAWLDAGPGMQASRADASLDTGDTPPYRREDEHDDARFYANARYVQHIDAWCRAQVTALHAGLLQDGDRLLDLMSSWVSHLPVTVALASCTGVGLNADELAANPVLDARVVQDLNRHAVLPFGNAAFDAAVCTVSLEYLRDPPAVLAEVARVLVPGGRLAASFSERWFPPKAIAVWAELHAFERIGLVCDWLQACGGFRDLSTRSARGAPRPVDDPYADRIAEADAFHAVTARRQG